MTTNPLKIGFIGLGIMGGAIARGLIVAGHGSRLVLIDPNVKPADARAFRNAGAKLVTEWICAEI